MRYEMLNPILEELVREGRIRKKAIARVVPQARGRGTRKRAGGNSGEEDEMNKRQWLEELKANPKKIRFARICKIAEAFGFQTRQRIRQPQDLL